MTNHERNIRAKLETTRHTKLNRYSEMHFDAPVRCPRRRQVLNAAARNGLAWFVDILGRTFT